MSKVQLFIKFYTIRLEICRNICYNLPCRYRENIKSNYQFLTKANTLQYLYEKLRYSEVLELLVFSVEDFLYSAFSIIKTIKTQFKGACIIVRSSAKEEDNPDGSLAGHFKSVLNINSSDDEQIYNGIKIVISSYKKEALRNSDYLKQQIFIQKQILPYEIDLSGVAFSYDPHSQAPYYFVSYDNHGSTSAVTSGEYSRAIYLHRDYNNHSTPWNELVKALHEIEELLNSKQLDIEFAILKNGKIIIFQVRRLVIKSQCIPIIEYDSLIQNAFRSIEDNTDIYSDMSFWNPAEMIGCSPHPLDYSIYNCLLLSKAWNQGLVRMGYTQCENGLMIRVGNHPYISLRRTIRSLLPANTPKHVCDILEKFYFSKIKSCPEIHDKVEFELIYNCYYAGVEEEILTDLGRLLSVDEINNLNDALFNITKDAIIRYENNCNIDIVELEKLRSQQAMLQSKLKHVKSLSPEYLQHEIKQHIKAIHMFIAPQFAFHARNAFISKKLMDSVLSKLCLPVALENDFISSIPTIVSEFMSEMHNHDIPSEQLNEKYGHIRNSTYDLLSRKYSSIGIEKLRGEAKLTEEKTTMSGDQLVEPIANLFGVENIKIEKYLEKSIQMRELLKFEYAHSVSILLDTIEQIANVLNITINDMVYLPIDLLLEMDFSQSLETVRKTLYAYIQKNKLSYENNLGLIYPAVISSVNDCFSVEIFNDRPNFVTNNTVVAEVVYCPAEVLSELADNFDLNEKILLLEKAEPGNDWIFSRFRVAGIIAKYGGAASHMAIRCLEQGIPAALGCGEKIFRFVQNCHYVSLDCKKGEIKKIS